jgi:hypothetical protein
LNSCISLQEGITPFHLASESATVDILKILYNRKPDVAIHLASESATVDILKILYNRKPEVGLKTKLGVRHCIMHWNVK